MKSITKNPGEHPITVYDGENEVWTELSSETQRLASYVHQQVILGTFISAVALKKVVDERLYLALGCQTRDEYLDTQTPFGRRQAYKLLSIANKFDAVSKQLVGQELKQLTSSQNLDTVQSTALSENPVLSASNMGIEKLYELTKMEDSDLSELIDKGSVNVNGEVIDFEELKEMTVRDTNIKIAKATKEYRDKLKTVTTKLAVIQEEANLIKSENKTLLEENKFAKQLERQYGSIASTLKVKQEFLDEARALLNRFNEVMIRCGVNVDDPEAVREDFTNLLRKVDEVKGRIEDNYGEVIAAA